MRKYNPYLKWMFWGGIAFLMFGCALLPSDAKYPSLAPSKGTSANGSIYTPTIDTMAIPSNAINPTLTMSWTPLPTSSPKMGAKSVSIYGDTTCILNDSGGVKCLYVISPIQSTGESKTEILPIDVAGLASGVKDLSVGGAASCVLMQDGSVKCWGNDITRINLEEIIGLGEEVADIVSGGSLNCVLTVKGTVMCWEAENPDEIIDIKGLIGDVTSLVAGNNLFCAILKSGGVTCWYEYRPEEVFTENHLTGSILAIAISKTVACIITMAQGIQCWGKNDHGQLGYGGISTEIDKPKDVLGINDSTAIAAGDKHVCSLSMSGGVLCWGDNEYGELGNGTTTDSPVPMEVTGLQSDVIAIDAGTHHTCAVKTSGEAYCWGQMGSASQVFDLGSLPAKITDQQKHYSILAMAVGYHHTCVGIQTSISTFNYPAALKCWGNNQYGQLGDGTTITSKKPIDVKFTVARSVYLMAAGQYHTCGVLSGEGVACWGKNDSGQLGDGSIVDRNTPAKVNGLDTVGRSGNINIRSIAAGGNHTCVLYETGEVFCWGNNQHGQLGDGTTENRFTPVSVQGLSTGAQSIVLGEDHTCARLKTGKVKCWGRNDFGQLGDGTWTDRSSPVDISGLENQAMDVVVGNHHTCAMTTGYPMFQCWGSNQYGQLGDNTTTNRNTPVVVSYFDGAWSNRIMASGDHTCATAALDLEKGRTGWVCWGGNQYGLLGNGSVVNSLIPVWVTVWPEMIDSKPSFKIIESRGHHTCFLFNVESYVQEDSDLECWGDNSDGQLGDGTTKDSLTPKRVYF
jgi:alpha-tubulin suppressor-like RCC1 family protein